MDLWLYIDEVGRSYVAGVVLIEHRRALPREVEVLSAPRQRLRATLAFGAALMGTGLGLIVGFDGTPLWSVVRLVALVTMTAGEVVAVQRMTTRAASVSAVALASVGLPIGGTIALSFATTTGLSVKTDGGVIAATGALVLMVVGTAALIHAASHWRRVLAVPIAIGLVLCVGYPVAVAVYATNVPRPALGRETPADRGLLFRDATLITSDGVELSGWYIPSKNKAAVVVVHGASSTRSSVLDQAAVIAEHGYGALLFDARGHGRSGGRAMEFGWYGDRDIAAAIAYLEAQPDVDPTRIGAVGLSMGGEEAIGAMASNPVIRTVVAEGATNRTAEDKGFLSQEYGFRGWITERIDQITYGITDLLTDASPPPSLRDAVAAAGPRRVLLITAGNVADEGIAATYIASRSPDTVEIWEVPEARHTGGLRAQPDEWVQRVTTFLDRALLS